MIQNKEETFMRKRVLAVLLTAAMAVSALAGCGSKSADTKTDDTKAAETTTAASAGKNEMAVEGDDGPSSSCTSSSM